MSVVKVLNKHNIQAAFFFVGENVLAHENVVRFAFESGHQIGNHSYLHRNLAKLSEAEVFEELKKTDDLIRKYERQVKLFRPPFGSFNTTVKKVANGLGYKMVWWNVNTLDYEAAYQPDRWVQHGIDRVRARPKSTVLLHDVHKTTAENLNSFIERAKEIGGVSFESPSTL